MIDWYVNVNATGANDGTSPTDAYTSQNAYEIARAADLPTETEIYRLHTFSTGANDADTTPWIYFGWETSAAYYIDNLTDLSDRSNGTWQTTKYRSEPANAPNEIWEDFVRITGMQVGKSSSDANDDACIRVRIVGATNDIRISKCVIKQAGNATYREPGIYLDDADLNICIWNNYIIGGSSNAGANNSAILAANCATACVYSNTIDGYYNGIKRTAGTVVAKNNLVQNVGNNCFDGTFDAASDYNGADDATSTGGTNDQTNQTFTFVGAGNWHLSPSDTGATDLGTDTSGESAPLDFTDDYDGDERGTTWSMGADEPVAVGGLSLPVAFHHYNKNIASR